MIIQIQLRLHPILSHINLFGKEVKDKSTTLNKLAKLHFKSSQILYSNGAVGKPNFSKQNGSVN